MKKDINQLLKSVFERDFNNAKKSAEAEKNQKPFRTLVHIYPCGYESKRTVCIN